MRARVGVLAAALALVGCGVDVPSEPARAIVRDSAAVRIVEHAGDPSAAAEPFRVGEPLWLHGGGPGDYLFEGVWTGALAPDGSAVVGDGGSSEIVVLRPDGSWSFVARSGEGPGEVGRVTSVVRRPDGGFLAQDVGNAKFLVLTPEGVEEVLSFAEDRRLLFFLRMSGLDAAGHPLMTTSSFRSVGTGEWIPGHMVRLDLEARTSDTVGTYPLVRSRPRDAGFDPYAPFGHTAAWRGGFVHVRSDRPEVAWWSADGRLEQLVRWAPERSYPDGTDREAYARQLREDLPRVNPGIPAAQLEDLVQRQVAGLRIDPDRPRPLFLAPVVDAEGRVWLPAHPAGPSGRLSDVFTVASPDGMDLRRVVFPRPLRILDVSAGRVLAVVPDDMDVEHVALYEVGQP